jgi:predicted Zn finger-like uncharacterized protein
MSLATRCTACGTVFRVVQDQLKVSEGWVRCGRCSEVFNALEGLFDLEGSSGPTPLARDPDDSVPTALSASSSTATPTPTPTAAATATPPEPPAAPDDDAAADDDAATTQLDTRAGPSSFERSRPSDDEDAYDRSTLDSRARYDTIDSEVPEDLVWAPEPPAEHAPAFLRADRAAAAWQRPRVQRSLKVLAALLLIGLALQVALTQRDTLAARWPAVAPWLAALCMGCSIEAPRELEMLAVESSGLSRIDGSPAYRLQVALRNRGVQAVAMPAFDLTLTDMRGEVIVRRVLQAGELAAAAPATLGGGSTWSVNAVLDVGAENRVAGYTVELFYP